MDKQEYKKFIEGKKPKPNTLKNVCMAFLIGGAICLLGEGIKQICLHNGCEIKAATAWTAVSLIFLGSVLTGLGVYDKISKVAGAGTLVPITGFANAVTSSAIEFKTEGFVAGLGSKMFAVAGPVIIYGVVSGVVVGILHLIF